MDDIHAQMGVYEEAMLEVQVTQSQMDQQYTHSPYIQCKEPKNNAKTRAQTQKQKGGTLSNGNICNAIHPRGIFF
jgi:hypothetical protein